MRELTFRGFLSGYVRSLSLCDSSSLYRLAKETENENPRLLEPLFLHAMLEGKADVLLKASKNCSFFDEYEQMTEHYSSETLIVALKNNDSAVPENYCKVWRSYQSVVTRPQRDARVKELIRKKVLILQEEKGVTTYRISKDNGFNNANVSAWLKTGESAKLSLNSARDILDYLEQI